MRLIERNYEDPELKKLARDAAASLANISKDNMKLIELTGITSATPDSSLQFMHKTGTIPSMWFFLEGRIYVPKSGASENRIDIRSAFASEPFRLLIIA